MSKDRLERMHPLWSIFLRRVGRGSVVVGNVGDNSVSSYRLRACETQQLTDATPRVELLGAAVSQWRANLQHNLATQRLFFLYKPTFIRQHRFTI